ncbi:MAG: hypothetical protein LBC30_03635, partial [Puniceicoccales bacterium]|nr:hypothetical protein [Puniceicoccales bacterium]
MDGIAQSTSTPDELQRMALLEQIVKDLRKEAVNAKASKTTTVNVNGRLCNITAARSKKKMEITAEYVYTPLGSRVCQQVAKFRYNRRNVGNRLKTMVEQIYETDRINAQIKADKIAKFSAVLNEYITQGIKINKLPTLTPKIKEILDA